MSCEGCGAKCCSAVLPTSFEERKKVQEYIDRHGIKAYNYNKGQTIFDQFKNICPFLDPRNQKCMIYPVRFEVCRDYDCHRKVGEGNFDHTGKKIVNFYEEFLPDAKVFGVNVKELDEEYQKKKREVGIE